ncbi:MAG: M15 family metallopeptidase [Patescibacteria group bacterium]|jgi:peptidoglycan L-alanyl-D-glutamate endopeptidase CwlK
MANFSPESEAFLATLHPDMQRVLRRAIKIYDFKILCGLRTEKAQAEALAKHTSTVAYPESKHNRSQKLDGTYDYKMSDAVDCVPFPIKWPDLRNQTTNEYVKRMGEFYFLAGVMFMAAAIEGVPIRWGGRFKSLFDGPHFERIP